MNILSYIMLAVGAFLTFASKPLCEAIIKDKREVQDKDIIICKFFGFIFVLAAVIILFFIDK